VIKSLSNNLRNKIPKQISDFIQNLARIRVLYMHSTVSRTQTIFRAHFNSRNAKKHLEKGRNNKRESYLLKSMRKQLTLQTFFEIQKH